MGRQGRFEDSMGPGPGPWAPDRPSTCGPGPWPWAPDRPPARGSGPVALAHRLSVRPWPCPRPWPLPHGPARGRGPSPWALYPGALYMGVPGPISWPCLASFPLAYWMGICTIIGCWSVPKTMDPQGGSEIKCHG